MNTDRMTEGGLLAEGGRPPRQLLLAGALAGSVAVAVGAAVLTLSHGGTAAAVALPVTTAVPHLTSTPSATPGAGQSTMPALRPFRDPFAVPTVVSAALAPAVSASPQGLELGTGTGVPAPAASAPPAVPATSGQTGIVQGGTPIPGSTGTGSTGAVPPGTVSTGTGPTSTGPTSAGSAPTPSPAPALTVQYVQLLAAHHDGRTKWTVDVRTPAGVFRGVHEGTKNVGGTLFAYVRSLNLGTFTGYGFSAGPWEGAVLVPLPNGSPANGPLVVGDHMVILYPFSVAGGMTQDEVDPPATSTPAPRPIVPIPTAAPEPTGSASPSPSPTPTELPAWVRLR